MSLTDQIRVFASAEIILAPSGAALANLIFSNSKAKIFVFVPKSLDDFDIWIKLGAISGATVKNISVESLWQGKRFDPYHQMHSPMIVSLGDLRKCDFNIAKKTIELKYVNLFEFLKQFSISKNPYKYLSLIPRSRVFRYTSISLGLIIIRFFSMILKK